MAFESNPEGKTLSSAHESMQNHFLQQYHDVVTKETLFELVLPYLAYSPDITLYNFHVFKLMHYVYLIHSFEMLNAKISSGIDYIRQVILSVGACFSKNDERLLLTTTNTLIKICHLIINKYK